MIGDDDALVAQLDSFDAATRRKALDALIARDGRGPAQGPRREVNLHCHTFFSYNGYGWSPTRFAWEATRYGLAGAAIVDFDVLDAMAEFLQASRTLGLKAAAGFESRVFVREYSDKVINSPHEPGIMYLGGLGFTELPPAGSAAADTLNAMARCARERNVVMCEKVNAHLDPVTIDYEADVLPLTPAGNATERHMLAAYEARAREVFADEGDLVAFWADRLDEPPERVRELVADPVELKNVVRSRLMKYGGVGYAAPSQGSFPTLDDVVAMTLQCGAIPSACWLDGTNAGEADPAAHFGFMRDEKSIPTATIIPDRNWNVADPDERALKVANLHAAIDAVVELEMPLFVGTEMNKYGQKFVDTFDAPAMEPYRQTFLDGAHVAWGHTLLKMTAGVGLTGDWAEGEFGGDRGARNEFFRRLGAAPYPDEAAFGALAEAGADVTPGCALQIVRC